MVSWLGMAAPLLAQTKSTVSVTVQGSNAQQLPIECVQSPLISSKFDINAPQPFVYSFTTDQAPLALVVDGNTTVLMMPGDSVHAAIRYENKSRSAFITGSPEAVAANKLRQQLEGWRRKNKYHSQLLKCVALDQKPTVRLEASRRLAAATDSLCAKWAGKANATLVAYVRAEQEAAVYQSLMEYPKMYEDVRKQKIADQGIGDYWALMDGVQLRDDDAAMACPEYGMMLMRYCAYMREKQALAEGKTYALPNTLEAMYAEFAGFFEGRQRDYVLYNLLCNYLMNGKQIERMLPLVDDYKAKYNLNAAYVSTLEHFLQ